MHILTTANDDLLEDWLHFTEHKLVCCTQLKLVTSDKLKGGIMDSAVWTGIAIFIFVSFNIGDCVFACRFSVSSVYLYFLRLVH